MLIGTLRNSSICLTVEFTGHNRIPITQVQITRRCDGILPAEGSHHFQRRHVAGPQSIGIEPHDYLLALPPNGGGAETPGRLANIGRTRNNAKS